MTSGREPGWAPVPRALLAGVLAAWLALGLAGCGSAKKPAVSSPGPAPATSPPTGSGPPAGGQQVAIKVGADSRRQAIEGFGAYQKSLVYGTEDYLSTDQRRRAIEALYRDVRLNTGNLDGSGLHESPGDYGRQANDNGDPSVFDWKGFQTDSAEALKTRLIDLGQPLGFDDYYLAPRINIRYASKWLKKLREDDYTRFLDEAAEQVAASYLYWRDRYGITTPYAMLFNEPLSGNGELADGTQRDVVEITKRAGARLEREGFGQVRFVLANEETEAKSLATARAVLEDPVARPYVGAIGYHPYPYAQGYSSVRQILETSARGAPDAARIRDREQLRDLGAQYGVPVWMTEVTDPTWGDPRSFDAFRARAVHIHDELTYANASVYQGMLSMWDTRSNTEHFEGQKNLFEGDGNIVLIDLKADTVTITGMGYAIGHYARWITPGRTFRLDATSSDPLVQVTAFHDESKARGVLVLINNDSSARSVAVDAPGLALGGPLAGEQSAAGSYWQPLSPDAATAAGGGFSVTLPALSVTSIALPAPPVPSPTGGPGA